MVFLVEECFGDFSEARIRLSVVEVSGEEGMGTEKRWSV